METWTELATESRKMRVSFLVLFGVIAVCNTNAYAKAVTFASGGEANGIGRDTAEPDQKKETGYGTTGIESDTPGGDHTLTKRDTSSDLGKKLSIFSKKSDKKKKIESNKVKYEEHSSRTVSNKNHSVKKDKSRHGRITVGNWYVPQIRPKPISFPVIYSTPWVPQGNVQAKTGSNSGSQVLLPRDILRLREISVLLHHSLKEGLERVFEAFGKELKKKLEQGAPQGAPQSKNSPVPDFYTRSSCIDTGDGSCESDSTDDAYDTVCPNECSDDTPAPANDSDNEIGSTDVSKRSESPLQFIEETLLPVIVQAVESALMDAVEGKTTVAKNYGKGPGIIGDYDFYGKRSSAWGLGDEDAEPVPDEGVEKRNSATWEAAEDEDADDVPAE